MPVWHLFLLRHYKSMLLFFYFRIYFLALIILEGWFLPFVFDKLRQVLRIEQKRRNDFCVLNFVTLRCGILTLKTSDLFFRSFRFLRQNEAFSATEQNENIKIIPSFLLIIFYSTTISTLSMASKSSFWASSKVSPLVMICPIRCGPTWNLCTSSPG